MKRRLARVLGAVVVTQGALGAQQPTAVAALGVVRGTLDGAVTDTGLVSLSDATVSLLGTNVHVATGANGRFRIAALAAGDYIVVIHRLGYVPLSTQVHVAGRDTLRLTFTLSPITNVLDTVTVTSTRLGARMMEFDARRKAGIGHFMTSDEIVERNSIGTADLLRTIMSVRVEEKRGLQVAYNTRSMGQCPYQIYVDGLLIQPPVNLSSIATPHEIAGIEVYSGSATLPLQFKTTGGSSCGAILIWTRSGN